MMKRTILSLITSAFLLTSHAQIGKHEYRHFLNYVPVSYTEMQVLRSAIYDVARLKNCTKSMIQSHDKHGHMDNSPEFVDIFSPVFNVDEKIFKDLQVIRNDDKIFNTTTILQSGDTVPDFTARRLDGSTLSLSELKGLCVAIHFWSPKSTEFTHKRDTTVMNKLYETSFSGPNSKYNMLVPIAVGKKEEVAQFLATHQGGFFDFLKENTLIDENGNIFNIFAKRELPRTYVLGNGETISQGYYGHGVLLERLLRETIMTTAPNIVIR